GSLFLTRPTIAHYIATRGELVARAGEVLGWIRAGTLKLRIGLELPLAQAAEAHRQLDGRATTGEILLIPWDLPPPSRPGAPPAGGLSASNSWSPRRRPARSAWMRSRCST